MQLPPPISTRTDTLVPSTTLFRSGQSLDLLHKGRHNGRAEQRCGLIEERYADDLTGKVQPGRTLAALDHCCVGHCGPGAWAVARSEEHTSELQSLMRISYAVFCLKKKSKTHHKTRTYSSTTIK